MRIPWTFEGLFEMLPIAIDSQNLDETGWAVVFSASTSPAVRDALSPLLDLRRQCTQRYRELVIHEGESKSSFLARYGRGAGRVYPDLVPYYLLLIGDAREISYEFERNLGVEYAVGRICFETSEEYARYARSVVEAETKPAKKPRRGVFFGVRNEDDQSTFLSADHLVAPLAHALASQCPEWTLPTVLGNDATKAKLSSLLGGKETPAFLFTASHGMSFPDKDPRQRTRQGAILCQDWPGPRSWRKPVPPEFYLSADDVNDSASVHGAISFHASSFSIGTRRSESALVRTFCRKPGTLLKEDRVSALPRRLLSHPNGGVLAVIGHVEQAWGQSFLWDRASRQLEVLQGTIRRLLLGETVGSATEYLREHFASTASDLLDELLEIRMGKKIDAESLVGKWTTVNDARSLMVFGDPAVKLAVR